MKVLYDYQIFSFQRYGGISRYFYEIIKGINYELPLVFNNNAYFNKGIDTEFNFKGKIRIYNFVNKLYSIYALKTKNFDIFHPTYYNPYFVDYLDNQPFVLTIHDMIHEKFPSYFSKNDEIAKRKEVLAKKASRIIAVSYQTKKDIVEILGIDEKKIDVIYHGSSFLDINEDLEFSEKLPNNYILFTGTRGGYKNFNKLIEAIYEFLLIDDLYLICAGGGNFTAEEMNLFQKYKIEKKVLQFNIDDSKLKSLYKNSKFFIFPSLYEGFGIPLLEAMSSDCPILCSNTSCFPEIVGNNALYFDPYSSNDIKEKVNYALNYDLDDFVKRGKRRLEYFSWDKARKETINSYEKVLNEY